MNVNEIFMEQPNHPPEECRGVLDHPKDFRQVRVVIGGDGKQYLGTNGHFDVTGTYGLGRGIIALLLPDSVAEHYRQQGRRQLQAEMRSVMNAKRQD